MVHVPRGIGTCTMGLRDMYHDTEGHEAYFLCDWEETENSQISGEMIEEPDVEEGDEVTEDNLDDLDFDVVTTWRSSEGFRRWE